MSGYKQKTHKATQKRFRKTAGGYKHRRAFRSHLLTDRSQKRKRNLRDTGTAHPADTARIKRLLAD